MIELKNVSVTFEKEDRMVRAVSDVNLQIQAGEIFGIVGYSGAGKSTLVRTINLLQRPSVGEVIINGIDLTQLSAPDLRKARKKIGMIFQHFNLMNSRTVAENVAFPLKGTKLSSADKETKVYELLDKVGIKDKAQVYPDQLSGGQKQRVAIARALATDPTILLCDEATSALDPKTTQSILNLLRQLNEELQLTIIMITHDMNVVKNLCHRVAVMAQGQVIEENSILKIFTQPQKTLTQEFINMATHFDWDYELVLKKMQEANALKDYKIARFSFVGQEVTEPFIAQLAKDYQVHCNILYGNIEALRGSFVGNLLVTIQAEEANWTRALSFLEKHEVNVEILTAGEDAKWMD
ncbi:methionine ABC transporter ATP-binding protein [Facklamia miroungae]|uniref:D-methionine transport system ATP-binding protein n=1 Tax=Facklamia miroungae TaxID=120956 RepID=A0A1G7SLB7_9LACT|nr:ATP-binding cassette domain-containing protein [Facklamia miroungae]NKZ29610.1 ATP-binding cassette domain-containing protein [Facklamia miroungae]SDG23846.1 D-methionine transport system ATP-binding protein [Facklamia miroungae]